ncbi:uncharacterized protein LOC135471436 [Liolophura sinensis]|uniref:uncharacterized protein LOC135471436 n=1 Tax=Liolophura sinensis TaxID=3198878 RepID=UPI0031596EC6
MAEMMTEYMNKLPVIGTEYRRSNYPPPARQVSKLTKDQQISNTGVKLSFCLPPVAKPRRNEDFRQKTFDVKHDIVDTTISLPRTHVTSKASMQQAAKAQETFNMDLLPLRLPPLANQGRNGELRQKIFNVRHDIVNTKFPLPKIHATLKPTTPTTQEQKGNINASREELKLKLAEKLLRETERAAELRYYQMEGERYLEHLRRNWADIKKETDKAMGKITGISARKEEVREALKRQNRDMADLKRKYTIKTYRSQRLKDVCARLEAEMAREMSLQVTRKLDKKLDNKLDVSRANVNQNSSDRPVEEWRRAKQEASVPVMPYASANHRQAPVHVKGASKDGSGFYKFISRMLSDRKRSDGDASKSRKQSPIQSIKRKCQKLICRLKGRNRVTPSSAEN